MSTMRRRSSSTDQSSRSVQQHLIQQLTPQKSPANSRAFSAPPDYRVNKEYDKLLEAFGYYFTSLPFTLCTEESPIVMRDVYKQRKEMPKTLIAPDGYIPNSCIRQIMKPAQVEEKPAAISWTESLSQKVYLEQLVRRYLSDERTRDTLSSITFLKDVALLRVATAGAAVEKMRNEMMANLAMEVEGLLERPCEQVMDEELVEQSEAMRMQKSAKMHRMARQITKQAVQKHFEQKIKRTMQRESSVPRFEEEVSLVEEEEPVHSASRSTTRLTPTNWRTEEDLIDRIDKDQGENVETLRRLETEKTLPYDFVKNMLDRMANDWGNMAKVMDVFRGGVQKEQSALNQLDNYLKAREARVGMVNSVVSPAWAILYLTHMVGTTRLLLEQVDSLTEPDVTPEFAAGAKAQLTRFLGNGQRLDNFLKEFSSTRQILINALVRRGVQKDAARNVINDALAENTDAVNRISTRLQTNAMDDIIQAVRTCNKDRLVSLLDAIEAAKQAMDRTLSLSPEEMEITKEIADSSLLAQLDADARRVMLYDGVQEEDDAPSEPAYVQRPTASTTPLKAITPTSSEFSGSLKESSFDIDADLTPLERLRRSEHLAEQVKPEDEENRDARESVGELASTSSFDRFPRTGYTMDAGKEDVHTKKPPKTVLRSRKELVRIQVPKPERKPKLVEKLQTKEDKQIIEMELDDEPQEMELMEDENLLVDAQMTEEEEEELAEIIRAATSETESEPVADLLLRDFSETEQTGSQPARYPEEGLLSGHVKIFKANPDRLDHLIDFETVEASPDLVDVFLEKLAAAKWFPGKNPQLKKEVLGVLIIKEIANIRSLDDLKEAIISLVLLKRQYGLGVNCIRYVVKQSSKWFSKYLGALQNQRRMNRDRMTEIFIRSLGMLSIMTNFGLNVANELEQIEAIYRRNAPRVVETSIPRLPEQVDDAPRRDSEDEESVPLESLRTIEEPKTSRDADEQRSEGATAATVEVEKGKTSADRKKELEEKLRKKAKEKKAKDRVAKLRSPHASKEMDTETDEQQTQSEQEDEKDEIKLTGTSRLDRKKKALSDLEMNLESDHDEDLDELDNKLAEDKVRRKQARKMIEIDLDDDTTEEKRGKKDKISIQQRRSATPRGKIDSGTISGEEDASVEKTPKFVTKGEPLFQEEEQVAMLDEMDEARRATVAQFESALERCNIRPSVKDFLLKQGKVVGSGLIPSVSLLALADALKDPDHAREAEEIVEVIQNELRVSDSDPTEIIRRIRFQMDHTKTGKSQPINKIVNLLSVLLAVESEATALVSQDMGLPESAELLAQAEKERERQKFLSSLVDEISAQMKYEYSMLVELDPMQRAVWMSLQTQNDTMRECCEKIGQLVSANAMTPELASFITSLFAIDLVDYHSILQRSKDLGDAEKKVIYQQGRMMLEVLSWFNVRPKKLIEAFRKYAYLDEYKPILESPPDSPFQIQDLDIVIPDSFAQLVMDEYFPDFTNVQVVADEPRQPLEFMYNEEASKQKLQKAEPPLLGGPSRSMLTLITKQLADIKRTFEDPAKYLALHSPLVQLSAKLLDGMHQLTKQEEVDLSKSSGMEESDQNEIMAFETSRIPITHKDFTTASMLRIRKKTAPSIHSKTSYKESTVDIPAGLSLQHTQSQLEILATEENKDVLALIPGSSTGELMRIQRQKSGTMQVGSLAVVKKAGEVTQYTKLTTPPLGAKRTLSKVYSESPKQISTKKYDTQEMMGVSAISAELHPSSTRTEVKILKKKKKENVQSTSSTVIHVTRESGVEIADSTLTSPSESKLSLSEAIGQGVGEMRVNALRVPLEQPALVSATLEQIQSLPQVSAEPSKVTKQETVQQDEQSMTTETIAETDEELGGPGVWTWLDNVLTAKVKSRGKPHTLLQPLRLQAKRRADRGFQKTKPIKMKTNLEEKVTRLQNLVQDIEDTDVWYPPPLATEAEATRERISARLSSREIGKSHTTERQSGAYYFTVTTKGLPKIEPKKSWIPEDKQAFLPPLEPDTHHQARTSERFDRPRRSIVSPEPSEKLTADLDTTTKRLQSIVPPGRLTTLLAEVREDGTSDAVTTLEGALLRASQKVEEKAEHCRGEPRPSQIPLTQWRLFGLNRKSLMLQPDSFRVKHRNVHCRYALLAQKGFHKQDLSIAAHLARIEMIQCINKSIQERAYRRIQSSMMECLKKVMN